MIKKSVRYIFLYGFKRTAAKALYRIDNNASYFILRAMYSAKTRSKKRIVFVGLGNHGFTLLAFFVSVIARHRISLVIDPSPKSKILATKVLRCPHFTDIDSAIVAGVFFGDIIYIASDHQSHTPHACVAVDHFSRVYIEKPLFVNSKQMLDFRKVYESSSELYAGFNRPYAPLFKELISNLSDEFSVTMVINGHFLPLEHWYRSEDQGSRVLGNLTHWIDLAVRIFIEKSGSDKVDIQLSKGHLDDLVVILTSGAKKICLSFSANCEPSDGVEEYIFWNCSASTGRILNFRKMHYVTKRGAIRKVSRLAKDVGHKSAALAPLYALSQDASITYISSALALKVEEMYLNGDTNSNFNLKM
jgi:predicted dehydrogenase